MQYLPPAFAALAAYPQFVVYKLVPSQTRIGKTDKLPLNPQTLGLGDAHDPRNWLTFNDAAALATAAGPSYGVGFTFTESSGFFFLDIDNALQDNGQWSTLAVELCATFRGAAIEVSQSGKGLHIIGRVSTTHGHYRTKNAALGLELYTDKRFCALTGFHAQGDAGIDCTGAFAATGERFFGVAEHLGSYQWTTEADPEWVGPSDDNALIEIARRTRSAASLFGAGKATFADLFDCNVPALAATYPSSNDSSAYDESQVDAALAQHLAFWTGKNCDRIERIMRMSALVRDKWARRDYMNSTIGGAVARQHDVFTAKQYVAPSVPVEAVPVAVEGSTFLDVDSVKRMFTGCVYVSDVHKIMVPGGEMLNENRFNARFGGYTFVLDARNERTTRVAYEAFITSEVARGPQVQTSTFRPDLTPGVIINEAGVTAVNKWFPIDVPRKQGDPSPFLRHLAKLLPDARDREILLSYMAACVQHPGVKFQWAPLIQGVEGNGKTLLTTCVAKAIGEKFVHWPKASKLAKEFNAWMVGKLLYGVEDIYKSNARDRADIIEELKPMITGINLEIEGKGVDQINAHICGNFIFNTNHKDAVRKTRNDRRFANFHTAQQDLDDINRDMGGDYFPDLFAWLNADGFAIVADLLHTLPINPEFNPAGKCHRAPTTSSTERAIVDSIGNIEQEVLECVEQGVIGFCGGWISASALNGLLDRLGASRSLSLNKRRDLLVGLGYDYHPGLPGGRVTTPVLPDKTRTKLFVKKNHPASALTVPGEIARAYEEAQAKGMFAT